MGEIRRYRCGCGYEKDIYAGAGMGAINLRNAQMLFPEEGTAVKEAIDAGKDIEFHLDNAMVLCSKCREISTVARLNYTLPGEPHRYAYLDKCGSCGGPLSILQEDEVFCPKCGESMGWIPAGDWD